MEEGTWNVKDDVVDAIRTQLLAERIPKKAQAVPWPLVEAFTKQRHVSPEEVNALHLA